MAAHINPMHEAQDTGPKEDAFWVIFEDFFGRGTVHIPLLDLRPYGIHFTLTRFMIVEVVAAVLVALSFIWLARRVKEGGLPRGRLWNFLEMLLVFVRDDIARPILGEKDARTFLPYLWTVFFFVLTCNLIGMVPLMGSPTASIWMTGGLALCSFILFHAVPIYKIGFLNYLKTMWVPVDVPVLGFIISLLLFFIELLGTFIKAMVLAIRLFANIFAGHVVLATILVFAASASIFTVTGVAVSVFTVLGAVALSLLELLVACLQAYIFTFLTALFVSLPLVHHAQHEAAHGHGSGHEHDEDHGTAHAAPAAPGHGH
jgi:F-type H+-transporting ATPase subunit a